MEEKIYCSHCGILIDDDDYDEINGQLVCSDCISRYTTTCERCGATIWDSDAYGDDYITLCCHCYENYYSRCAECDALIHNDDTYEYGGEYYCSECYHDVRDRDSSIHEYNYKPGPIFYGDGNRYFGIELEIDGAGKDDDYAEEILDIAKIKPQLLTVECHPYYVQKKLRKYLAPHNIIIEAWYPLGHGDHAMMDEPVSTKLAEKYHKTPVQIILRWHTQYGTSVIPGSKTPSHIEENNAIYDFTLTEEEMKEIDALDCGKHYYTQTQELLDKYASMAPDFNGQDDGKE